MLLINKLTDRVLTLFLILLLAVPFCFCKRERTVDSQLLTIDSLLQGNPDSAYRLLVKYDKKKLAGSADTALFELQWAEARYKTYHDDTNSSALKTSEEYFRDIKDSYNLMRTLYYKGLLCYNKGANGEALICFDEALENADSSQILYKGLLYSAIGNVATTIHDWKLRLNATRESWRIFQKLDSIDFLYEAELEYGMSLVMNDSLKGSKLLHKSIKKAIDEKDTSFYKNALIYQAKAFLWKNQYDSALLYLNTAKNIDDGNSLTLTDKNLLLLSLLKSDSPTDSIETLAKSIINTEGKENVFYEYFEEKEDYRNAFLSLKKEYLSHERQYANVAASDANYLRTTFRDKRIETIKNELELTRWRNSWMIIAIITIIVSSILAVFLITIVKNNKIKIALNTVTVLNNSIAMYEEKLHSTMEYKVSKNSPILSQLFSRLDNLYAEYYRLPETQSNNRGIINAIREEIDYIRHNEDFLVSLENEINHSSNNLLKEVYENMKRLSTNQRRLVVLLYHHFSNDSICLILDIKPEVFYNRKARLKKSIIGTLSPRVEELLGILFQSNPK